MTKQASSHCVLPKKQASASVRWRAPVRTQLASVRREALMFGNVYCTLVYKPSRREDTRMKGLERSLGIVPVVAISMSAMLGSGVFILPGLVFAITGPLSWLAYLLAALCVFPAAASKSELATAMPTSGGTFVYVDRIFGPLVGTITGLALWLSTLLKAAFALLGVGTYLSVVLDLPVIEVALFLTVAMVLINWIGVSAVSKAQVFIMAIAVGFLALLGFFSLGHLQQVSLTDLGDHSPVGVVTAAGFVIVAYNGVTKIAAIAEEVKDPQKTVPWGIFLSLGIVSLIYIVVSALLTKVMPSNVLAGDLRPVASWAQSVFGQTGLKWAGVIGSIALLSLANAGILAASRFPFAMARDQLLPKAFERLSPRFQTPVYSIVATGLVIAVAVLLFDVAALAKLASAMVIALYIANNVAVLVFREVGVGWYRPRFKSPFYPWVQLFGVVSGLGLLLLLGGAAVRALVATTLFGAVVFFAYGRSRVKRRGIVLQRGKRRELIHQQVDSRAAFSARHRLNETPLVKPPFTMPGASDAENLLSLKPLRGRARSVVAMFGDERAPETLAEIGTALSGSGRIPVVHLTEVPEQTILGAVQEAPKLLSLRRRLRTMGEEEGTKLEFHALASRDIANSVQAITTDVQCDFLVMSWRGRSRWALSPYNPLGWMVDHLDCNVAVFRDMGVRYMREILVYPEPGPHDALVVTTADDLAFRWGARLTLVRPHLGLIDAEKEEQEKEYLRQLESLCESPCRSQLVVGKDSVNAIVQATSSYDLLVMASPKAPLIRRVMGTEADAITHKAACSVLTLKTARSRTHEALERRSQAETSTSLVELVQGGGSFSQVSVSRKEALFEYIALQFAQQMKCDAKTISQALWSRERTQNTSVGHGVALPHASLDAAPTTLIAAITSETPIDYHGPDGQPVDVFFVILSPPGEREHCASFLIYKSSARNARGSEL